MLVQDLDISSRSKACLIKAGYVDVLDVIVNYPDGIRGIKNLNKSCFEEISCAIDNFVNQLNGGEPDMTILSGYDSIVFQDISDCSDVFNTYFSSSSIKEMKLGNAIVTSRDNNSVETNDYGRITLSVVKKNGFSIDGGINYNEILETKGQDAMIGVMVEGIRVIHTAVSMGLVLMKDITKRSVFFSMWADTTDGIYMDFDSESDYINATKYLYIIHRLVTQ